MFTISVKGVYYGCRDANDVYVFYENIIFKITPNEFYFFYKTIAMVFAMVIFYHDIFSLPSIDNLGLFYDK